MQTATPTGVDHQVAIVGTGFGGMGAAIQLKRMGIDDFVMLERDDDLGGTWHANRYPGVAVDIASPTYSYSFEPNPNWSRLFAPGNELKDYAVQVADTYDLRRHMRFHTTVMSTYWDDDGQFWTVEIADGDPITCRQLVLATGILSQLHWPDIPGLDDFEGRILHTAAWNTEADLTGERVALIGTGATGVQVLPAIAADVEHVTVYQRTPIWVTMKPDLAVHPVVRRLFKHVPLTQKAARVANAAFIETIGLALMLNKELPFLVDGLELLHKANLFVQVRDPELRRKLTPDYDFWCKRPTFSNDYFKAYTRDNVSLVSAPIQQVTANGIVTEDGVEQPIDTLILATGFTVQDRGAFPPFPVHGRDGLDMGAWYQRNGYESYQGITVHGFPNLFYLSAPFAFTGLSFFYMIESQMEHMKRLIDRMSASGATVFEVKREAQTRFVELMDERATHTVWHNGSCGTAHSYYFNEHGQTRLGRLEPTLVARWRDRHFPFSDYRFEAPRHATVHAGRETLVEIEPSGRDGSLSIG